jgi:hypothetical protein
MTDLDDFAEKYFSKDYDKAVPLALLRAWLSEHHDHGEDGVAFVPSMALDEWAQGVAVTRIVDRGPGALDKEVWSFFQHGWHKDGCEGRLAQARARVGDPLQDDVRILVSPRTPQTIDEELEWRLRGGSVVEGVFPESIAKHVGDGFVGGLSISE